LPQPIAGHDVAHADEKKDDRDDDEERIHDES
jgi:hypothetical protein